MKNEKLLHECRELYFEHNLPKTYIATRLKIKYTRLTKIIKENITDPEKAFLSKSKRPTFKKIY